MVGKRILHYHILEELGRGGMGVVYKAHDTKLKRDVAIKFLPHQIVVSEEERERFKIEAQAAAALNHPNIATIHAIEEADDEMFIVMEYIEGRELRHLIKSPLEGGVRRSLTGGVLPFEDVLAYAIQIASGLQAAHEKGVTHRDIKSANIMITDKGQAKIMDFGLAKVHGGAQVTRLGTTLGTASYMSPEQARGEEVDERTDIWSLGVIFYEMLTDELPFKGDYEQAVIYSILNEQPAAQDTEDSTLPGPWVDLVARCLQKDRDQRYPSAEAVLDDLREMTEAAAPIARSGLSASGRKPESRPSRMFWLATALAAVILVVASLYFFSGDAESTERIPIAVADFVNQTGETELDGLSGMLITSLEQSRRLSVFSRSRMFDILKQMGRENIDQIDETLGRELCKQAKVHALAVASIRKLGQLYTVDLKVLQPESGEYLFTAREEGSGQESILSMIDKLSEKTRKGLKEKEAEIQVSSQKIAEVTTPNLEAYQHYFKGEELIDKLRFEEAQEAFKRAIAIDSTFGLAYYRLAYAISWQVGSEQLAREPMQKAMGHIDRIPERERYLVRAHHARLEEGVEASLAILKEMEKVYPNDKEMLFNIGDRYYHIHRYNAAADYFEKVLASDASYERALQHITLCYRDLHQYDKAVENAKKYVDEIRSPDAYATLGALYGRLGDFPSALEAYKVALPLFPNELRLQAGLGNIYAYKEDYRKAEAHFKAMTAADKSDVLRKRGYLELAYFYPYLGKFSLMAKMFDARAELARLANNTAGIVVNTLEKAYRMFEARGNTEEALREIEKVVDHKEEAPQLYYFWTALLYADMGKFEKARPPDENLIDPLGTMYYEARVHHFKKEWDQAISLYKEIIEKQSGFQSYNGYAIAQCYYEKGELDQAIREIEKTQRAYGFWHSLTYPRSFYLLAKIYEKKKDVEMAIENFETFIALWKDADEGLPELTDAKARLATLQGRKI